MLGWLACPFVSKDCLQNKGCLTALRSAAGRVSSAQQQKHFLSHQSEFLPVQLAIRHTAQQEGPKRRGNFSLLAVQSVSSTFSSSWPPSPNLGVLQCCWSSSCLVMRILSLLQMVWKFTCKNSHSYPLKYYNLATQLCLCIWFSTVSQFKHLC